MNIYAIEAGNTDPKVVLPRKIKRPNYQNSPLAHVPPPPVEIQGYPNPVFWFWTKTWWIMCGKKRAFFERDKAVNTAFYLAGLPRFRRRGQDFMAYECPFCEWYHLGHQKKQRAKRDA